MPNAPTAPGGAALGTQLLLQAYISLAAVKGLPGVLGSPAGVSFALPFPNSSASART